jgi:hypothetical protein
MMRRKKRSNAPSRRCFLFSFDPPGYPHATGALCSAVTGGSRSKRLRLLSIEMRKYYIGAELLSNGDDITDEKWSFMVEKKCPVCTV